MIAEVLVLLESQADSTTEARTIDEALLSRVGRHPPTTEPDLPSRPIPKVLPCGRAGDARTGAPRLLLPSWRCD